MLNAVVDAEPLNMLVDDGSKATALRWARRRASPRSTRDADVKIVSSTTQAVLLENRSPSGRHDDTVLVTEARGDAGLRPHGRDDGDLLRPPSRARGEPRARHWHRRRHIGVGDIPRSGCDPGAGAANHSIGRISPGTAPVTITISGTQDVIFSSPRRSRRART